MTRGSVTPGGTMTLCLSLFTPSAVLRRTDAFSTDTGFRPLIRPMCVTPRADRFSRRTEGRDLPPSADGRLDCESRNQTGGGNVPPRVGRLAPHSVAGRLAGHRSRRVAVPGTLWRLSSRSPSPWRFEPDPHPSPGPGGA